jgi:hypothetical protein
MHNVIPFARRDDRPANKHRDEKPRVDAASVAARIRSLHQLDIPAVGCVRVAVYQLERAAIRLQQSTKQIANDLLRGELEREIVRIETSLVAVKDRLRDLG